MHLQLEICQHPTEGGFFVQWASESTGGNENIFNYKGVARDGCCWNPEQKTVTEGLR